jgi:hypothetical protein
MPIFQSLIASTIMLLILINVTAIWSNDILRAVYSCSKSTCAGRCISPFYLFTLRPPWIRHTYAACLQQAIQERWP